MTPETLRIAIILTSSGALVAALVASANPYKLRHRTQTAVNRILPPEMQQELLALNTAWVGKVRITTYQLKLLSLLGSIIGIFIATTIWLLISPSMALLLGTPITILGYMYPTQRYRGGFPKSLLADLEHEAVVLSSFMYQARGISNLSVQVSFEKFIDNYPTTKTAALLSTVPDNTPYPEALLSLGIPSDETPNWTQVITTLNVVNEIGDPKAMLKQVRDRVFAREVQNLRTLIKRKAFMAPALTVLIILPGLLSILLGAIILQAVRGVSGTGIF